jgi:hypothetical protein
LSCKKIENENHADIHWARPESKSRVITIDQTRELMQRNPAQAHRGAIQSRRHRRGRPPECAGRQRLSQNAGRAAAEIRFDFAVHRAVADFGNHFVPLPAPEFFRRNRAPLAAEQSDWLQQFSSAAAANKKVCSAATGCWIRCCKISALRARVDETLTARSPLEKYGDAEKDLREKWEDELKAAIEAEYRRQRAEVLLLLQWWLRDVWLHTSPPAKNCCTCRKSPAPTKSPAASRRARRRKILSGAGTNPAAAPHQRAGGARARSRPAEIAALTR